MLRNYTKVAIRTILHSKVLSSINIFGLGLGIGSAILLGLFVWDELTFDQFHEKADQIHRVWTKAQRGDREMINSATPFSMGRQLFENYPEVEKYTVFTAFSDEVEVGANSFNESISVAGEHFFEMFTFNPIAGSLEGALSDPKDVIITRAMAEKYFETESVAGQTLSIQVGSEPRLFDVKAVVENIPTNSSLQFDFVISDHYLKDLFPPPMLTSWNMITGDNYIQLSEQADPNAMTAKFHPLVEQEMGEDLEEMTFEIRLQPLTNMHLNTELQGNTPTADPMYILILAGIALLILVIAAINFVTLALGRSFARGKEIGIRKSIGAAKKQLVFQFMSESLLITLIAAVVGILLALLGLPTFNELSGKELQFDWSPTVILGIMGLVFIVGLLSGIYPALVMAGFNPTGILKGNVNVGGKNQLRSILVTGQFILSIFLITTTLIMKDQLSFLQNKNLGFDKEQVIAVPINVPDARGLRDRVSQGMEKAAILARTLEGKPGVVSTGIASHTFEPGTWTQIGYMDMEENRHEFFYNTVSEKYIPTMGMQLVEGRSFDEENQADKLRSVIVNEAFVKAYGLENPIGDRIPHEDFIDHEIIGVVKDFHIESLHAEIAPLMMAQNVEIGFSAAENVSIGSSPTPKLMVKLAANQVQEGLSEVRKGWEALYIGEPFDYSFVDENLKAQYENEASFSKIMTSAALLAIIIGCLGLFGLATLTMNSRLREVSIRKVLGASGNNLLITLNRKFVVLIMVALLISAPFTYYAMDQWLNDFEYRISITVWEFALAGFITLAISLFTVTYQTFRTIRANPATVLRSE